MGCFGNGHGEWCHRMSSIDTFCKICDTGKHSVITKLSIDGCKLIDGTKEYVFTKLFTKDTAISEIYSKICSGSTDFFLRNYNSCFIILGSRSHILPFFAKTKENPSGEIFLNYFIEQLHNEFTRRKKTKPTHSAQTVYSSERRSSNAKKEEIRMSIYEISESAIKDLLVSSHGSSTRDSNKRFPELVEDDFDGVYVKNLNGHPFSSTSMKELLSGVQVAVAKSRVYNFDGASSNPLIVEFSITRHLDAFDVPVKCWFRLLILPYPSLDKGLLEKDKENAMVPKFISTFQSILFNASSSNGNEDVNGTISSDSRSIVLGKLLSDPIGGNCITSSLLVIDQCAGPMNEELLKYTSMFTFISNFPVENLPHVKGLLSKLHKKIRMIEKAASKEKNIDNAFIEELKGNIHYLEENVELISMETSAEKLSLENQLNDLKDKYNKVVASHSEICSQNVLSTAEKLKMAKESIELKMLANKLQQKAEQQVFELKKELLSIQQSNSKLERTLAYERKSQDDLKDKFSALKNEYEDVCEEYMNVKMNFQSLTSDYQEQVKSNRALNEMISQLSIKKDQLGSEKSELEYQQMKEFNEKLEKLSLVISTSTTIPKKVFPERSSLGNEGMEKLREEHHKELEALEEKLFSLKGTLNENAEVVSSYKQRLIHVTSKMIVHQDEKELMANELAALERKIYDLSKEYRNRMHQYIEDIKSFIQSNNKVFDISINETAIMQITKMVEGLEESYKQDTIFHENKVKSLNTTITHILNQHERLLVGYRMLLYKSGMKKDELDDQVLTYEIILHDSEEFGSFQMRERNEIRTKLCIAEQRVKDLEDMLQTLREKLRIQEETISFTSVNNPIGSNGNVWNGVQKKMHKFTTDVQLNLEKEKAEILTRCLLAEQELEDCRNYMEEGFRRYRDEINRLQQILNSHEQQLIHSAGPHLNESHTSGFLPPIGDKKMSFWKPQR